MTNRRKFLRQTGSIALGSLLLSRAAYADLFAPAGYKQSIGLQLYTLSDLMASDPKDTLQKVAAIGYRELETAASPKGYYYGYKPKELAGMVKDMGMLWRSQKDLDKETKMPAEVGTGIVDFKRIFENAKTSGMKHFFVEQDQAPQPLQNVTNSFAYLNKMLP